MRTNSKLCFKSQMRRWYMWVHDGFFSKWWDFIWTENINNGFEILFYSPHVKNEVFNRFGHDLWVRLLPLICNKLSEKMNAVAFSQAYRSPAVSPIHTFLNIPALIRKRSMFLVVGPGYSTVWKRDILRILSSLDLLIHLNRFETTIKRFRVVNFLMSVL